MTNFVLTSITDHVLHIEFNRPDKKNALTQDMYTQAAQAIEDAESNPDIRAIIFSGRGDSFTAGNDLSDFLNASAENLESGVAYFLRAVPSCSKPIVAAVHGHAVGIGTTLLLHCDLVYAQPCAKFQMPFVNLALCPEFGSSVILPRLIGQRRAAELLLLGKSIDANTALDYGLLNNVVDNAIDVAQEQALSLSKLPASAVRLTKKLLHDNEKEELLRTIETESILFNERLHSPEAKEAMTAFMEKRTPDFSQFD